MKVSFVVLASTAPQAREDALATVKRFADGDPFRILRMEAEADYVEISTHDGPVRSTETKWTVQVEASIDSPASSQGDAA